MSFFEGENCFSNFKPFFRTSDLGLICVNPSEKSEIQIVLRYWPFKNYKQIAKTSKRFHIEPEHEELVKKEWQNSVIGGDLSFDDEKVIDKVMKKIRKSYDFNEAEDSVERKPNKKLKISSDENSEPKKEENIEKLAQDSFDQWLNGYEPLVRKSVYCTRGKILEKYIIDKTNKTKNFNFVHNEMVKSFDFGLFKLFGVPDGIDYEKKIFIEVKTRTSINQDQPTVYPKEKIQCLCYMKMLNYQKCILVESNDKGEQNSIEINWDESEFEEKVLSKLRDFVQKYRNVTGNEFMDAVKKYYNF
ncbi:unnamed protein product [Brachionus calyciflorus]|uniref:YqaJ viral recombinase domain-containing protein n=1 Tax=Brachionus calyciflorus TaxID=104777 RepID=A0A814INH9_9BILA|nr:unnamed protein product [Brachionus calyciflorus]